MQQTCKVKLLLNFLISLTLTITAQSQLRQVYKGVSQDLEMESVHFISPAEGFVTTRDYVGYTTDSGRTITKKLVTMGNVDFNGNAVNLTFGYYINGIMPFSKDEYLLFGHYGLVPAILQTTNGGSSYKLVYHSQFDPMQLRTGITDMVFPGSNTIGFAVDADRILKTTNRGASWTVVHIAAASYFNQIDAVDANNIYALGRQNGVGMLMKSTNGGGFWTSLNWPNREHYTSAVHFQSANLGWISVTDAGDQKLIYKTTNGGLAWTKINDPDVTPFSATQMFFTDPNTGFALDDSYEVYKTTNGGAQWNPLPRDNNFSYLNYGFYDFFFLNSQQFWTVGGHEFIQLSTNAGGNPLPKPYFSIDTVGVLSSNLVSLNNQSLSGASYKWFVNGKEIAQSYNASYSRNWDLTEDIIKLVNIQGNYQDSIVKVISFPPKLRVTGFSPSEAGEGQVVTITGKSFFGITNVYFGSVKASSFTVQSPTSIRASVSTGASGFVKVVSSTDKDSMGGFIFYPPPSINSALPISAPAGSTVTIQGRHFLTASEVRFAGVLSATIQILSDSVITAIVPSSGYGGISVTSKGGNGNYAGFNATPVIQSFTPLRGTEGTIMNIYGTSLLGITELTVGGKAVKEFKVVSPDQIQAVVADGNSGNVVTRNPITAAQKSGFLWVNKPSVSGFSPLRASAGFTITINGTGFEVPAKNNIVMFGGVRAEVTGGTPTALQVIVPVGAPNQVVTVVSNGLLSQSIQQFCKVFGTGNGLSTQSFDSSLYQPLSAYFILMGDFNADGKLDILPASNQVYSSNPGPIVPYRNTSTPGNPSFVPMESLRLTGYVISHEVDLDNDGLNDLLVNKEGYGFHIYRNVSTRDSIRFSDEYNYRFSPPGFYDNTTVLGASDFDGDGKVDIFCTNSDYYKGFLFIMRNNGEIGRMSFAKPDTVAADVGKVMFAHLNGDDKLDVLEYSDTSFIPWFNTSKKGQLSFSRGNELVKGSSDHNPVFLDFDGDGRQELFMRDFDNSKATVYKNTGFGNNLSFKEETKVSTIEAPQSHNFDDLDGDGVPDLICLVERYRMAYHKTILNPGKISFSPQVTYPFSIPRASEVHVGDIDGDGRNDLIQNDYLGFRIFLNAVKPEPVVSRFSPNKAIQGDEVLIYGYNFSNATRVSFGLTPSAYTVLADTLIRAVVGPGSSGAVSVENTFGKSILYGFMYGVAPEILSVSPITAIAGATITIKGNRFGTLPSENKVIIGGTEAQVLTSSGNTLTVAMPVGGMSDPTSVTVSERTGFYYPSVGYGLLQSGNGIGDSSFVKTTQDLKHYSAAVGDVNNDNKPDMVSPSANGFIVAINTSGTDTISWAPNKLFSAGVDFISLILVDLDVDGKKDIAALTKDSLFLFRNKSTIGAAVFEKAASYLHFGSNADIKSADMDLDGLPDLVSSNYSASSYSVYRNISSKEAILMEPRIDRKIYANPIKLDIADFNNDRRPDLIIRVAFEDVLLAENSSKPGTMEFEPPIRLVTGISSGDIKAADLDGDGKIDFATAGQKPTLFRNLSTPDSMIFESSVISIIESSEAIDISDLDGDGRPDLILGAKKNIQYPPSDFQGLMVLVNQSTPGSFKFLKPVNYSAFQFYKIKAADINGDGLTDIVSSGLIWKNMGQATSIISICSQRDTVLPALMASTSYQWQVDRGSGFVDLQDNTSFTGSSESSLLILKVDTSLHGKQFRCKLDNNRFSKIYKLSVKLENIPTIAIKVVSGTLCPGSSVTLQVSYVNGGITPELIWYKGTTPIDSGVDLLRIPVLSEADSIWATLLSKSPCSPQTPVVSNKIYVTSQQGITTVQIKGDQQQITGLPYMLNAVVNYPTGNTLDYQWQDSTSIHTWMPIPGANKPVLEYFANKTGDRLRVEVMSGNNCALWDTVYSNVVVLTVLEPGSTPRIYPNPVLGELFINGLLLDENWQELTILNEFGARMQFMNIVGMTSVRVDVQRLPKGYYTVILHRSTGSPVTIRFLKL